MAAERTRRVEGGRVCVASRTVVFQRHCVVEKARPKKSHGVRNTRRTKGNTGAVWASAAGITRNNYVRRRDAFKCSLQITGSNTRFWRQHCR